MRRRSLLRLALGAPALLLGAGAVLGRGALAAPQTALQTAGGSGAAAGGLRLPVGVGLSGISDWGASQPFIDVFRHSREWNARSETAFTSHDYATLRAGGYLDADGWPLRLPEGARSIGTIILCDLAATDTSLNGRYRMTWRGRATVRITGTATGLRQGEGWAEFDYVASDKGIVLIDLSDLDPADPPRDFVCVHRDLQAAHEAGQLFRPDWLALLPGFEVLRFMDWMATNNSRLSDWADRPTAASASWTHGVPVEVMVRMANELGIDPWFCLPHLATEDYVTRFATHVRDNLAPGLVAHYEYSNEVWNFQFDQTQWALAEAEARWPGQGDGWMQLYGARTAWMAQLLDAVHGGAGDRHRVVLGVHTAWFDLNHAALDAPLWVAEDPDRRPPKAHAHLYAVTGYFDGGLGRPANVAQVQAWRAEGDDAAFARMAEQMRDARHIPGEEGGSTLAVLDEAWRIHKGMADDAGLALVMYEGGSHIVPDPAAIDADPGLFAFYERFQYSQAMADLYTEARQGFADAGGAYFNVFVEVARPGRHGFWGARRHVGDDNPRWRAIAPAL